MVVKTTLPKFFIYFLVRKPKVTLQIILVVRKYSRRKISWSGAAVLLEGTLPNIPNHGCKTLTNAK